MANLLDAPDQDDHVRDLLMRRIPQALETAQNGNLSFPAAYWGVPPPLPNPTGASTVAHSTGSGCFALVGLSLKRCMKGAPCRPGPEAFQKFAICGYVPAFICFLPCP